MSKSMKERVSALLAKANDPAASEAEANACIAQAMKLMSKFGFSLEDIQGVDAEEVGLSSTSWTSGRAGGAMIYVMSAIAGFTNTKCSFLGSRSAGTETTYYGYGPERDLAVWLHKHILNAIKVESRKYQPGRYEASIKARLRKSFAFAMAGRISERLKEMTDVLDNTGRGTGTDVLVLKNKKLEDFYEEFGFSPYKAKKMKLYSDGIEDGKKAGDKVSLHRPIEEGDVPLAITAE